MTTFQPFVMERMMSLFEQDVEYNLSESGVHPILLRDLLADTPDMLEDLLQTDLNYPHVRGCKRPFQDKCHLFFVLGISKTYQ